MMPLLPCLRLVLAIWTIALLAPHGPLEAQDPGTSQPPWLEQEGSNVTTDNALVVVGEPAGEPRDGAALAQITEEVADGMRCPVCQGLSINASPSQMAQDMKEQTRELLAAGYAPEQVVRYFEASYGEFVRLTPKPEGFNLMVWIVPLAGLLAGATLVLARVRKRAAPRREGSAGGGEEIDPELLPYLERVRREVAGEVS